MARLRERLRDLEATLRADLGQGRMVVGALRGGSRLRVQVVAYTEDHCPP